MEKQIKSLVRVLWIELVVAWLLAVVALVLGQLDVIPNGIFVGEEYVTDEFALRMVCIMTTLVSVPLSFKLFSLNTTRGLRRLDNDEALASYHLWSAIRLLMMVCPAVLNIVGYYLVIDTSYVLCAVIALASTGLCIPSDNKVRKYMENLRSEESIASSEKV